MTEKNAVKSETVSPAREFEIARLAVRSNEYLEVFWGAMPIKQFELYEREKAETFVSAFNLKLNIQFRLSSQALGAAAKEAAEELDRQCSPAPPSANFLQRLGGTCFAHGEYGPEGCPKWPACATDPQIYKTIAAPQEVTLYDYKLDKGLGGITRPVKVVLHSDYVSLREELQTAKLNLKATVEEWNRLVAAIGAQKDASAVVQGKKLKARAEKAETELADMRKALQKILASATPNQREHPTMWAAWRETEKLLFEVKP